MRKCIAWAVAAAAGLVMTAAAQEEPYTERALLASPAPGPYLRFGPETKVPRGFSRNSPVLATSYFYWYNDETGEHFVDHDGTDALTDHPANPKGYRYSSADWHRRELRDVMDAGIDVVLPVYWGNPADRAKGGAFHWSFAGIPPLVEAVKSLRAEGRTPPMIGVFYDTSTLQANAANRRINLSTPDGRAWFYVTLRDFFAMVPPDMWATIEGRPIVFLYAASFASGGTDDPKLIEYVNNHFQQDFGTTPYIVQEVSWRLPADSTYAWGGAFGLKAFGVAALGPGYDDSAVPGRTTPKQDREDGAFYRRNWELLLAMNPARRPKMVHIETWNELHEGTDIAHSKEYGRRYIEMTREYAKRWKANARRPMSGPFAKARQVAVTFGPGGRSEGLTLKQTEDGAYRVEGDAVTTAPNRISASKYLYFDAADSFFFDGDGALTVAVEYLDAGTGAFGLEYDSADPSAAMAGSYKTMPTVALTGSGTWKTAAFGVEDPRFSNRQNAGADFRLATTGLLTVRRVSVHRQ